MKFRILAVGKLKERFWKEACSEYQKRLSRYARIEVVELDDLDPSRFGGEQQAMAAEAAAIKKLLGEPSFDKHLICMDPAGRELSSEQLAVLIEKLMVSGCSNIDIVIGGPNGIDPDLKCKSDDVISLGKITMPHNLARLVVLEQLYRSFKIIRGEPYHR